MQELTNEQISELEIKVNSGNLEEQIDAAKQLADYYKNFSDNEEYQAIAKRYSDIFNQLTTNKSEELAVNNEPVSVESTIKEEPNVQNEINESEDLANQYEEYRQNYINHVYEKMRIRELKSRMEYDPFACLELGSKASTANDYQSAIPAYQKSINLLENVGQSLWLFVATYNLACTYRKIVPSEYPKAVTLLQNALEMNESADFDKATDYKVSRLLTEMYEKGQGCEKNTVKADAMKARWVKTDAEACLNEAIKSFDSGSKLNTQEWLEYAEEAPNYNDNIVYKESVEFFKTMIAPASSENEAKKLELALALLHSSCVEKINTAYQEKVVAEAVSKRIPNEELGKYLLSKSALNSNETLYLSEMFSGENVTKLSDGQYSWLAYALKTKNHVEYTKWLESTENFSEKSKEELLKIKLEKEQKEKELQEERNRKEAERQQKLRAEQEEKNKQKEIKEKQEEELGERIQKIKEKEEQQKKRMPFIIAIAVILIAILIRGCTTAFNGIKKGLSSTAATTEEVIETEPTDSNEVNLIDMTEIDAENSGITAEATNARGETLENVLNVGDTILGDNDGSIEYALNGNYKAVKLKVEAPARQDNIVFKIYGDDYLLDKQLIHLRDSEAYEVVLNVENVDILKLETENGYVYVTEATLYKDDSMSNEAISPTKRVALYDMYRMENNYINLHCRDYEINYLGEEETDVLCGESTTADWSETYNLGGKYTKLYGSIVEEEKGGNYQNGTLEIYLDDELVYSFCADNPSSGPYEFEIDVTGKNILHMTFCYTDEDGGTGYFVNPIDLVETYLE